MNFTKYGSIEQHNRQKTVDYIIQNGFSVGEWVQLLKIHGANYSYSCDGETVTRGKRNSFLDENFYGDQNFDYSQNVMDLWKHLEFVGIEEIVVYGEIYGGVYNHPEVPKIPGFSKVQQEIQYCPENRFACFDIMCDGIFMNWDDVVHFCNMFEIPLVPELRRGKFEDLIQESTVFPDPLHLQFGLPTINGNDAEGWVMKPLKELLFHSGERVILKGRNPKFKDQNKVEKKPKINKLSDEANDVKDILISYINESRLHNVLSHGEKIGQKDFGKLMGLLSQDAFNDFMKDNEEIFVVLDLNEQKLVKNAMNKYASDLIRPHFVDILDGNF